MQFQKNIYFCFIVWAIRVSLVGQTVKNLSALQETRILFMVQEVPLEKGMVTHSSIFAWMENSVEEESGRLHSMGSQKSQILLSNYHSASLTKLKALTVWITAKFLKRWKYQTTLPVSWENCMQVKKQHNWTWNNRLVPNRKRSTSRLYIVTLLI